MRVKTENEKNGLKLNIQKTVKKHLNIQKTKIMSSGPTTLWQIDGGKNGNSGRVCFGGAPKSLQMVTVAMKFKDACSLEEKL